MSAWHCLAWLIRFCGGINSGSINCGSQHGIAWLGGFESVAASILVASIVVVVSMALLGFVDSIVVAVASILVASIVVVSMALLGLVDSNLRWHQFW